LLQKTFDFGLNGFGRQVIKIVQAIFEVVCVMQNSFSDIQRKFFETKLFAATFSVVVCLTIISSGFGQTPENKSNPAQPRDVRNR